MNSPDAPSPEIDQVHRPGIGQLAATSEAVGSTRSRKKKAQFLSELLKELDEQELEIAVCYLAGELRQGKIGLGMAAVHKTLEGNPELLSGAADQSELALLEVDARFETLSQVAGKGATTRRLELFTELLKSIPLVARQFVVRLILGELRHGALEGLMVEAIALASETNSDNVRRAVMLTGNVAKVAAAATAGGEEALADFGI